MKTTHQRTFLLFLTIFVVIFSLFNTQAVSADDDMPPVEPVATEIPVVTDVSPIVEVSSPITADQTSPEPAPISEILGQLPEDMQLVVVDEEGEVLPLATQEAAVIVSENDPMWCPTGKIPGDVGCTTSFATVANLIANLGAYSGAGTVYFTSNYNINDIVFDQTNINLRNLTDLTIQGGWNGLMGANYLLSDDTVFTGTGLTITRWIGNVSINNVSVNNASGDGITVFNKGNIDFANVDVQNSQFSGAGASLNNGYNNGSGFDISLSNINLENNTDNGLYVLYVGGVNLNNVTITGNNNTGAYLNNTKGNGDFSLTGLNAFDNNNGDGLFVASDGVMNLENISANNNSGTGVVIDNTGGNGVVITGLNAFNHNDSQGLSISSKEDIALSDIFAMGNGNTGAELGGANITVSGSNTFINNSWAGLIVNSTGTVSVSGVVANSNYVTGVMVDNIYGASAGDIVLNDIASNTNGGPGLYINSNGNININNLVSTGNIGFGAEMYNNKVGNVIIDNSTLSNNEAGATIHSSGNVSLNNITSNGNTYDGVNISNYFGTGNVVINNSDFSYNGGFGLAVDSSEDIIISNTTASGNASGASLDNYGNGSIFVSSSQFNSNAYYGIDAQYTTVPMLLNNVSFDCLNGLGDYIYKGTVFHACATPVVEENPASEKTNDNFSLHTVSANNGESIELNCQQYTGTMLILNNKNRAILDCPIIGFASLSMLENENLPGNLPEGMEYVSGMQANQSPDGIDKALDGQVIISFLIPENMHTTNLAILYWDGSQWLDLKSASFEDGRVVINGGHVTSDGYFEAVTNFSGNFVLVTK